MSLAEAPPAPPAAEPLVSHSAVRTHLPDLAQLGLGGFAAGLSGLVLLMVAASTLLAAIEGGTGYWAAAAYGVAAAACAAGGLSLTSPKLAIPGARFLPLGAAILGLAVAVTAQVPSRAAGPGAAAVILAGLVTLTAAVAVGVRTGAVLAVVLALLLGTQTLTGRAADAAGITPLAAGLVALQILLAAAVSLLLVAGLRRSASRAADAAAALDERLARDRAATAAAAAEAEAARTLHDTALNTLEAIAKGGAALDPALVRDRCQSDLASLREWHDGAASQDLLAATSRLAAHAHRLGVELEFRVAESADRAPLPPEVAAAFIGAARELVTNVAKHSGTDRAEIQVWHDADGVWVTVADRGVGMAGQAGASGFGLADSVAARMSAVGGRATISAGPDGVGTSCELQWSARPEEQFDLEPVDLNLLASGILTLAGLLAAGVSVLVILLGWASFQRPAIALAAAMLSGLALFAAGRSLHLGYQPGAQAGLTVVMTYFALSWAALLADPVCASVSGEQVGLDARLFLIAVVLLFLPRGSQAVLVIAAVLAGQVVTAWLWQATFDLCGADTGNTGFVAGAVLLAIWWFGRLAAGMTDDFGRSRADALAVAVRTSSNEQARLERQRWAQDTLAGAERILAGLVAGTTHLSAPGLADDCTEESGFLRGMLLVGRAPQEQARTLRRWLGRLRRAGFHVVVRGNFEDFDPPCAVKAEMEMLVAGLKELHGPGRVSLLAWGGPGESGLSLAAQHPLAAALAAAAELGLVDVTEGTLTVVWDWKQSAATQAGAAVLATEPSQAGLRK